MPSGYVQIAGLLTDNGALKSSKQSTGGDVTHGANVNQWLAVEHLQLSPCTRKAFTASPWPNKILAWHWRSCGSLR